MSVRIEAIAIAAAGCAAVALLIVLGCDIAAASRTGPRWKRTLLRAGLAALAIIGFFPLPISASEETQRDEALEKALAPLLAQRPEWKEFCAARAHAASLLSRRNRPIDLDTEGRAITRLSEASKLLDALSAGGKLSADELAFFRMECEYLAQRVSRAGTQGGQQEGGADDPLLASVEYAESRLDLLGRIASGEKLHSAIAREMLDALKPHRDALSPSRIGPRTQKDTRDRAVAAGKALEANAKALAAPHNPDLSRSPHFASFKAIWDFAADTAEKGLPSPCDRKRADRILAELDKAWGLLSGLEKSGWITGAEKAILWAEFSDSAEKVRERIRRAFSTVTCYSPAPVPASYSPDRRLLQDRLPLLEKIADQKVLKPEVLEKVLKTVEAALAEFEKSPQPNERLEDEDLKKRVKELLARIKSGR